MKKIAVTGATGFIGTHLIQRLRKEGYKVNALARKRKKGFFEGDLVKNRRLEKFLNSVDVVVNLVGGYYPPFESQLELNVLALNNLCQAAAKSGVEKIVHISSSAVYGSSQKRGLFTEKGAVNPDTLYGLSKYLSEKVASYYHKNHGLNFIILRPSNVYGPGNEDGVIYRFAKSIKEKGFVEIYGDGRNLRDYLYVEDMVEVISRVIRLNAKFEIFNVGLGKVYSLLDLVRLFEKILRKKIEIRYQKETAKTSYLVASNVNKLKRVLNWKPRYSLEEGLRITLSQIP